MLPTTNSYIYVVLLEFVLVIMTYVVNISAILQCKLETGYISEDLRERDTALEKSCNAKVAGCMHCIPPLQ